LDSLWVVPARRSASRPAVTSTAARPPYRPSINNTLAAANFRPTYTQFSSNIRCFATKTGGHGLSQAQQQAINERKKADKKKKGPTPIQKKQKPRVSVILTQNLLPTGEKGEELSVAKGFARNYLFARGLAVHATEETRAQYVEDEKVRAHNFQISWAVWPSFERPWLTLFPLNRK